MPFCQANEKKKNLQLITLQFCKKKKKIELKGKQIKRCIIRKKV